MPKSTGRGRRDRGKAAHGSGGRRYLIEGLEQRLVLSGTHDAALLAAIDNALISSNPSGFASFATRLKDSSAMGRNLPLVGTGLTNYDGGAVLKSLLYRVGPTYSTLTSLAGALEGQAGIGDGINVPATRDNPDDLELDLHFNNTGNVFVPIAGSYGINLSVAGSVNVATTLDFQVTVGAYWDAGTSSAVFYVLDTNDVLQVSTGVVSASVNPTGAMGVVDLAMTGASAVFSPAFNFSLIDQATPGQPGRMTLSQLTSVAVPSLVATTATSATPTSLTVNFNSTLAPTAHNLTVSWADLTKPTTATSTLATDATLSQLNAFQAIAPTTYSTGLDNLVQIVGEATTSNSVANNPFLATLPLVNKTVGSVLNVQQLLTTALTNYTDSTTDAQNHPVLKFTTAGQLLTLLRNLPGVGVANATMTASGSDIRFTLSLPAGSTLNYPLTLGIDSQLKLPVTGSMNVTTSTTTNVTFGVNTSNQFFVVDTGSPLLSATLSGTTTLGGNTTLGFLGVTITNGTATLTGSATLALKDPQTDNPATPGVISATEMTGANLNAMATPAVSGTAGASLPLSSSLSALSGVTGTLGVNWADIKAAQTFTLSTPGLSQYLGFNNITSAVVINGLGALPAVLSHAGDAASLGENLAFLGSSIGGGVALSTPFQGIVNALGSIKTAQDLQNILNSYLQPANVTVSVTANDVEFGLTQTQAVPGFLKFAVNVTEPNSGQGFQTTGTVGGVTGTYTNKVLFGLGFAQGLSDTDRFYVIPGANSAVSASFKVQNSAISVPATLGYLNVNVAGGSATLVSALNAANNATVSVPYVVPGGVGTQITLTKLQTNAPQTALGAPTTDGKVQLTFPLTGLPSPGSNPQIAISWANMAQPGTVVVTPSNLGDLTPGSNYSSGSAVSGLQSVINMINGWSNIPLLNTSVPLVGGTVRSLFDFVQKGTGFFQAVINAGVSTPTAFDTAVKNAIANAGLDAGSVTLTPQGDNNPSNAVFHYLLNFHYNVTGLSKPFNFGSSLFSLNANVTAGVQFNANLEFGLDKTNGFYLVDRSNSGSPEVSLTTGVTGAFNQVGGTFGPVTYGVANGTASVAFNLGLDLVSPQGAGGKIGPGDLANNITGVAQPEFLPGSEGTVDLPIGFFLGTGGPGAATEFKANWNPSSPGAFYFGTGNSTNPVDGFGPVQFELGDFVNGIVGPLVHDVQQYNPLPQKLIDLLNFQLPLIQKTPAQILGDVAGIPGFSLLFQIADVINQLSSITGGGTLNLSSYITGAPDTGTAPGAAGSGGTPAEQAPFQSFLSNLENNYGVSIPVLADPTGSVVSILLGQDVKLIEFKPGDNGHVEISKSVTSPRITIPIFSIGFADASVFAEIGGSVGVFANIDLGIDSSGLTGHTIDHSHNILDGFFIGNTDRFQVGFEGQVFMNLGGQIDIFGFPLVQVYGRLGLQLDLGLHVDDVAYQAPGVPVTPPAGDVEYGKPGGDGRVTYDELNYLISTYGLACTLELGGQLSLFGGIGFRGPDIPLIGPVPDIYKNIGTIPIIDFNVPCTPPPPQVLANIVGNSLVMVPDSGTAGKHVDLNVYYNAQEQPQGITFTKYDDNGTINQSFDFSTLAAAGVNTLVVEGTNGNDVIRIDPQLTSFYNFQYVTVNTHNGNDSLQWGGIDEATSHLLATTITAGDGNDSLTGTFRPDSITAGNGADVVLGLKGNDTITVGDGADSVQGGEGNDVIFTGNGKSTVVVGEGNSTVHVGNGGNIISGGNGNNTVYGGSGGDKYYLGNGANSVLAGSGGDVIYVGNGPNYVSTGAGNDYVFAGDGNNTIQGGIGVDQINAGQGNNNIYGIGTNTIKAGDGKNYVSAGPGNNIVTLGNGDNKVLAENGANFVSTGRGQDIIELGSGPDTILSGAGDDFIQVGPGNDSVDGGPGTNLLQVVADANFVLGNSAVSVGGASVVYSNIQRLTLTGGVGNNTFDISGYTLTYPVILDGNGGSDTVVSSNNLNFVLSNTSLTRSDNTAFSLKGIGQAILTGGSSDNSFDIGAFTGPVTIDGGVAAADYNRVIDTIAGIYTLTNISLTRSTGATVSLAHINRATLPGAPSSVNTAGFSGLVDLTGGIQPPTLSGSTDSFGRWTELGQSASNGGVSNSPATAIEPAIATSSVGQYVAWADNRSGSFQIYVAEHTAGGWIQLSGSAQGGGISGGAGSARRPAIAVDGAGNPIVAWTVINGASTDIQVATYVSGNWVALGTSLGAGGISGDGAADNARVVNTSAGPVVAWLDHSGGVNNVFVKQFIGGVWSAVGAGGASGSGVSASGTAVPEFSIATDGTNLAIAWTQTVGVATQIYLKQYAGSSWLGLNGSALGNGVSNTAGSAAQPSVAYYGTAIVVAYQATVNGQANVAAAMTSGGGWASITIDTPSSAGNAVTRGAASVPQLFTAGGNLELVWLERRLGGTTSQDTEIYANRFNGASFVRVLPGDASYNGIHWTSSAVSGLALSVDPTGRPFVAWGDTSSGNAQIYALGATFQIHNVYYVNDALTLDDSYTTAAGSVGNTGLTAASPLDSVQSVLGKYALQAGDVILVDAGTYGGFTLTGSPSGILVMGSGGVASTFNGSVSLTNAQGVILQSLTLSGGLDVTAGTNVQLSNLVVSNLTVSGGTGDRVEHSSIVSLALSGGLSNAVIVNNKVAGQVLLGTGGTAGLSMSGNVTTGGMSIAGASSGTITANDISGGGTALNITASFTGSIDHNFIHNASVGVNYAAAAPLNANRIYSNSTGVTASVNSSSTGLGFLAGSVANEIYYNSTGVNLTGLMQLQHVFSNGTGVTGSGVLGGATLDTAMLIELNTTGVNFTGTVQFNRIARNTVGIQATNGQVAVHNLIYRNVNAGVVTGGTSDVRIWNNTFYSTSGNNVQVDGGSGNVQAMNNILWSTGGYDLFIADNSRGGFFSDYNDLYTTGTGKIVHWLKDFTDVLDWQVDVNRFDSHSIGTTSVNPTWAQPQFANLVRDDFHVLGLIAGLRASSPTVDTGVAYSDVGLPGSYTNLLANPSFESGVTSWSVSVGAGTQASSPTAWAGTNYFFGGAVASAFAQQTISLTGAGFTTGQLDGQGLVLVFGGRVRSAAESPADQGRLIVTFLDGSSNPIGAADTVPATNANDRWELIGDRLHVPVGARGVTYRFEALRQSGSSDDSYLDGAFVYVIPSTVAPDQGAYGNTAGDLDLGTAHLHMVWPDLYTDWELSTPHNIQWSTYGTGGGQVSLDLYQDNAGTPQFLMHIATVADTGSYAWIPSSPLTYGTYGLRIQASLATNSAVYDRSSETFTIPENGHSFYVNDSSQVGDVYTTAVGGNRNTGKLPGKPKPLLTSLLRVYNLGGADTVYVDTGTYSHFDPVVISGNPAVGGDQGVTITGPVDPSKVAQITPLGFTIPAIFDVNNGNFMSMSHLTISGGDYGVWVRNNSSNFIGSYLTTGGMTFDGIRLEANSTTGASLDHITSFSNGRDGISVGGPGVNLTNSVAHHNAGAGVRYDNSGGAVLTGNQSYANKWGMLITNSTGTTSTVGNTNLALGLGNIVHDNAVYGIYGQGAVTVAGNTVYGTAGPGGAGPATLLVGPAAGQYLGPSATYYYRVTAITAQGETISSPEISATGSNGYSLNWSGVPGAMGYNVYRGNSSGYGQLISAVGGTAFLDTGAQYIGTQLPGYATVGIDLLSGATGNGNVVYNSYEGIYSNGGAVTNNRVFSTAGSGIYASNATATGNVSYSNMVGIEGDNSPTWTNNLIYANSVAGFWLHSGFSASIFNNTIYDLTGDGIRVESSGGNFSFQHVNIRNNIIWVQGGYALTVTPQAEIGFQSDYNEIYVTGTGQVGLWENVGRATLGAWRLSAFTDSNSISADAMFVNPAGADGLLGFTGFGDHGTDDDFHEKSVAGSFHGGSLAPVISANTGLPVANGGTLTADAVNSPAVDRGDPASSFANELSPNGGFINLGAYGNTAQASETYIPYVLVLSPNGGETVVEGQPFTVTWRSEVTTGTATIDLMNGANVVANIATGVANNGSYVWNVPTTLATGNYTIRVTRNSAPVSTDTSDTLFTVSGPTHAFYVNDGTVVAGDFTTAPGSDTNSGLDPAHPKASIRALLNAYNLGAGDVVYVDVGTYLLSSNIVVPAARAGVTIRGFYDPANASRVSLINRTSTAAGSVVFDVQANNVTLDHLSITGGDVGVNVTDGAGVTGLTVSNSDIYGNYDYNVYVGSSDAGAFISGNKLHDTNGFYNYGLYVNAARTTVVRNTVYNNSRYGIYVQGIQSTFIGANTVFNNLIGISADTSTIIANTVYNNAAVGISVSGNSNVTGNTTYNNAGNSSPGAGIQVYGGTVQGNISYGQKYGIYVSGAGNLINNRLYNNTTAGLVVGSSSNVQGNVIYNNGWGILANVFFGSPTPFTNNLIYGNTSGGFQLVGGYNTPIVNNTIYQTAGDAFELYPVGGGNTSYNVSVRNNIFWVTSGYDMLIDPASQAALTSDYNILYATGTGSVGLWQNMGRATLGAWQIASLGDANSQFVDPQFVNLAGADFHEQSLYGSFHGGSLAPVLSGSGLPVSALGTFMLDGVQSAAVDRGAATDPYSGEPSPNGGYVNIGAYGNTAQASLSPAAYALVTRPNGGENWIAGQPFKITWRSDNPGVGLVNIDLMHRSAGGGGLTLEMNIATGLANNGSYNWSIPQSVPAGSDYVVRVTRQSDGRSDVSDAVFNIAAATHVYYVNDATVQAGDWTTAPGDDLNNSGLDPAHPKASIAAIFNAYTLTALDTIKVDRGIYNLNGNIVITAAQSGIHIVGFTGADSTAGWSSSVLGSTPSAYYRFGEASGTTATDSSGNGRNATYVNGVTLGQAGALGGDTNTAATFNGTNQYVQLPTGFADFTGGLSYEFWAYPTAANNYARFLDLGTGAGVDNIVLYRSGTSGDLGFNVSKGSTFGSEVKAAGVLELNKWQYFVVTETSAGAVTIYKNGIVVATGTTSVANNVNRTLNYIGKSQYASDGYYAGRLDEAAIYNRALTPAEIANRYSLAMTQAVLNRGNTGASCFNFATGANNVTIDSIAMTGGSSGIYVDYNVGALNDTVTNCEIFNNRDNGIFLGSGNSGWTITNNRIHDNTGGYGSGSYGVNINGSSNTTITNNFFYNDPRNGINLSGGSNSTISGNTVYQNGTGIYADNATISNNLVHDNSGYGIAVGGNALAIGNTVYNSLGTNNYGIWLYGGEARSNVVYNSTNGIGSGGALIDYNRSFHNTGDGIYAGGSTTVTGNVVYSNNIGIEGSNASNNAARGPWFYNNLSYANTTAGMWTHGGADSQFINNTVYQPAGDALKIDGGSVNIVIRNNILYSAGGYVLTVTDDSALNFQSDYNDLFAAGAAKVGKWSNVDFPTYASWVYEWGLDTHSLAVDPLFVNPAGADAVLGYSGGVDHGTDDNFHLQSASPAIDAGNPASLYINEPAPNGSRINLGHLGNTAQADVSPVAQSVQITGPSNLQKLEAGHPYNLTWQTTGVSANQPVVQIDAGGPTVGNWVADTFSTVGMNTRTVGNTIDTSGVSNPAPQAVYQSYSWTSPELSYKIPVPDGAYTLRLHFMDEVGYIGKPVMNIKVNGTVVRSNYDLYADAGAGYKATALSFNVNASGGNGLLVEVVAVSGYAVLSALDLTAPNPTPVPSPTANLQVSINNGATWTTIATNQPLDGYGRGSFAWTPTFTSSGPTALFRVSINGTSLTGTSQPFAIYGGGPDYYVNDGSTTGDSITTAVGNNANSGKSPDQPLADIQAVLSQYSPGAGAVIHADSGTYVLVHDVLLQTVNNGLKIQGPANASAVINRANVGATVFNFAAGASNITLDHLSITGASWGIVAGYGTNNANITVSNSLVYGNDNGGITWGGSNPGWVVTGNTVHDNGTGYARSNKGIDDEASGTATISNNVVYNEINTGITVSNGQGTSLITGNVVYASGTGIYASNATISNNVAHDNTTWGIYADTSSLATGNVAYRQTATSAGGFGVVNAELRGNFSYGNYNGIAVGGTSTVDLNHVYSNTNFGISASSAAGNIFYNLVYANSAAGIVIANSSGFVLTNNTVYQLVGDALRLTASPNTKVRGNILWVEAGYDLNVSSDSQSGLASDYNDLYRGAGAAAHVGFWGGATQDQVSNWQTASSQDPHSISADPKFVNVKGADQVLGYNPAGNGYDGGQDDNFYLSTASPAIDHGYSWGPLTDMLGQTHVDDPTTANAGSGDYVPAVQNSSLYALTGTAQNWRATGTYWNYTLPFAFPFYDGNYTTNIAVSSSGLLQFAGPDWPGNTANSDAALYPDRRIAVLWDNISTSPTGNDIYVDTSVGGQVKFTWKATNLADNSPVNFSIVLFSNGNIRFDYGAGNTNLTPTVGVSMGDGVHYALSSYDNATTLTNANSVLWTLPPGFVDMGAYEYRGSGSDVTPPTVTGTMPSAVNSGGTTGPVGQIVVNFSEPLNAVDAGSATQYQLVWAGPDGMFGNADDVTYALAPQYVAGSTQVTLTPVGGGILPSGVYRLSVSGTAPGGIHDLSGNALDGDANGTAGGNYFRQFTLGYPASNTITGTAGADQISLFQDADHLHLDWTMNAVGGQILIGDPNGLTINGVGANDLLTLNFANGNPLPSVIHFNGTFTINGLTGANPLAGKEFEIGQSTLYFNYAGGTSPAAMIQQYIAGGYNGGAWDGSPTVSTGVITSAAAGPAGVYGVGYADSADGIVVGQPANTVEVRYTVMGDANLDRVVNSADAVLLTRNYLVAGRTAWDQGNFNYDTTINSADAALLQKNWNATASGSSAPASRAAASTLAGSTVSKPGSSGTSISTSDSIDPKTGKKRGTTRKWPR